MRFSEVWPFSRVKRPTPVPEAKPHTFQTGPPSARFGVDIPPELLEAMTAGGTIAQRISRDQALQVPAVLRSRNLIAGTLGSLPHVIHGPDRREVNDTYLLGGNIDPDIPNSVMWAQTYEDLFFEGISWWRVTRFGWHGFPVEAQHVPVGSVHVAQTGALLPSQMRISADQPFPADGQVYIDGYPIPDREIIRFDSPNPPLLRHAARAIRTCLQLDMAAALYTNEPLPLGYFRPEDGADGLSTEPGSANDGTDRSEVDAMLDDWAVARAKRAWGYVDGVKAETLQWNPEQLQLAAQRQHAVLEIARAAGVDPEDLGVSTTSRTYQNGETRRQDLLDFTLGAYVSAVQDRLSMRDVLPRGYNARVKFGGFLRSDTKTRMETYKTGLDVGAYTEEEIRELEDRPSLTASQRAARRQRSTTPTPTTTPAAQEAPQMSGTSAAFEANESTRFTFIDDPDVSASFRVDVEKRTISGLAVPWNKVAWSRGRKWTFPPGSLHWSGDSRVKMNMDHDRGQTVGRAARLQPVSSGLDTTFRVAKGPEGDRALSLADDGVYDGFSIEIDFDAEAGDFYRPDPADESVMVVGRATLRAVALTPMPAFDDARVTHVAASRDNQKGQPMTTTAVGKGQPDAAFDFDGYMSGLADKITESHKVLSEGLAESLGESISAGVKLALENITSPQDGPQPVRSARYTVTREAPVYSFDGGGHSLVRDAWYAGRERDADALERMRKYRIQTEEVAKLARAAVQFATVTTSSASAVIPPGYRPELYVPQLQQGRPLVDACSQGTISNATPFTVPVFGSVSGATADHVEGVHPTDGTLTVATKTVTPGAISGSLILTREIVDSSNPAIDQIALAAMRESYVRQTEGKVYTLVNGAAGTGGTITSGFVPSGAQASTIAAGTGNADLVKHLRGRLATYPFNRFSAPDLGLLGQAAAVKLAEAVDTTGRPLFPSIGVSNSAGTGSYRGWEVDLVGFVPAWAMTGVAAGDTQILILNRQDVWVWESPLLTFRYEEKSGPEKIELALFGYFGAHVLRPVGLSGIRIT